MTPYIYAGLTTQNQEVFKLRVPQNILTPEKIIDHVCAVYGVQKSDLFGPSKARTISDVRCVAIYLIRTITDMDVKHIGSVFNRDHSTISHTVQKFNELISVDVGFRSMFSKVQHLLG